MGRWRRHLDPSVKKAGWQRAEDELLRALVGEHGAAWSQISRFLPGRTPQQVRARWCQLEGADSTPASTRARARRPGPGQAPGSSAGELVRHLFFEDDARRSSEGTPSGTASADSDSYPSSGERYAPPGPARAASGPASPTDGLVLPEASDDVAAALLAVAQSASRAPPCAREGPEGALSGQHVEGKFSTMETLPRLLAQPGEMRALPADAHAPPPAYPLIVPLAAPWSTGQPMAPPPTEREAPACGDAPAVRLSNTYPGERPATVVSQSPRPAAPVAVKSEAPGPMPGGALGG